ncbi:coiled-coil domain-containing protein 110 [Anguilla anguilla]|uniref:coiled-coil domain-containing protein 110 n=1 Tax=Anguilla anguilla TaxID=7936 RepID=UPI0015AB5F23|nr:coiled-coil domain-containing protein 110 [Anguilla anguilla]XP_035275627.1 coiled-coil domain-containing protein 110 [Anguilla anguilla]
MDPNSKDERSSPLLQCEYFVQVQGECDQSERSNVKRIEGGKEGLSHAAKKMEDFNEALKRVTSMSAMLQSARKPSQKTDGPGLSQRVDNCGDCLLDTASKSDRMAQLEQTVSRLKNALISLEEENLCLNKKVKGSILAEETVDCGGPGPKPTTPSERPNTDQTPHEWPKQVVHSQNAEVQQETSKKEDASSGDQQREDAEDEKQDVHRKLKKVEEYCKECTKELGRVLRKYEELRAQNKALEKQCKQLTSENQRLEKSQKGEPLSTPEDRIGAKVLLDQANERCTLVGREKDQLEGKVQSLTSEVTRLREELGGSRLETQKAQDQGALLEAEAKAAAGRMGEEAWRLQGKLRESEERWELYESAVRKLREEQDGLESCLRTVQKERDLLQLEVRKLHQEYIELSGSISQQLRAKNSSRPSSSLGPQDAPSFSSLFTRQDKVIGEEKIDQIRKRLEEEDLIRAQKYKDMIDQSA